MAKRFATGDIPHSLEGYANVQDASFERQFPNLDYEKSPSFKFDDGVALTAVVGSYRKNAFGLHDMHGNVWEWCRDWYDAKYCATAPDQNPPGLVRCAFRFGGTPEDRSGSFGFRLVLE